MDNAAPLTGIRVVDLSQYIPGPFATRLLADLGAEVIKIEPPAGDPMRRFMHHGDGPSPLYRHLNRGKRVARIDLKGSAGGEQLRRLLCDADVLLESFRPGVLARLGLDRVTLQRLNPRLVHCALSGFGQQGPYRDRAGHDLTYCAAAGLLSNQPTDQQPTIGYPPVADHAGAMQAVTAILAALFACERSGHGSYLDISLYASALAWNYLGMLTSPDAPEAGLLQGQSACYNLYRTADRRWVALAALEEKFWRGFCERVGRPDWIDRQADVVPQRGLIDELQRLFADQPLAHWQALLGPADCCFETVPMSSELSDHPQALATLSGPGDLPAFGGLIDQRSVTSPELREYAEGEPPAWAEANR